MQRKFAQCLFSIATPPSPRIDGARRRLDVEARAAAVVRPPADGVNLRLTRYFGVSEGFFLGLQADHDLMERRRQIGQELDAIEPRAA